MPWITSQWPNLTQYFSLQKNQINVISASSEPLKKNVVSEVKALYPLIPTELKMWILEYCAKVMIANFVEILRKSAKFRGERIFGEISLASIVSPLTKFRADVRNFTWQIRWRWQNSFEISNKISNTLFVWAKFRTKISFGDRNFVHHLWSLHEGHKMQNANWGGKKKNSSLMAVRVERHR